MKRWTRILWAAALGLGMAAAGLSDEPTTSSQPARERLLQLLEMLEEGKPAFTARQADAMARQVAPLVEKFAGRKFEKLPVIKLAGRDELAKVLAGDLLPQLKRQMPDMTAEQLQAQAALTSRMLAPCLLGKYGLSDKVLYLLPRNLLPVLKIAKVNPRHASGIARIIIAHELTHALQDQEVGLAATLERLKGLDAVQAFSATIEGHAVFVQDGVGKALKLDEALLTVSRLLAAGALELDDPALKLIGKILTAHFEQIYLGGRKFIAHHHAKGGSVRVWQILAAPPASTAMIARPETYSPRIARKPDYAQVLRGLEKDFGPGPWQVQNVEVGQMTLRATYARMDPDARKEILSRIVHAQALLATAAAPVPKMANVSIIEFSQPAFVKRAIAIQEELGRKNLELMRKSALFPIEAATFEEVPGVRADVARKMLMQMKLPDGTATRNVILRIARGRIMLEMLDMNVGLDDKQLIAIAEKVFKRLEELDRVPRSGPTTRRAA